MEYRNIYDNSGSINVNPIQKSAPVQLFFDVIAKREKKEKDHREAKQFKKVKDYFKTLTEAAEEANKRLQSKNLPYRFCIFQKDSQVIIEFVILDENGKIIHSETRDITNDDFNKWVHDVAEIEGLLIDTVA